jgi:L-alanine-DL-glutamate epimerase-like enolase superfamily enzyme
VRITGLETFILHVGVSGGGIADGSHRVDHWGAPGVLIHTDAGLTGTGYTGTHAHLASDRLITGLIEEAYAPLLIGRDPREVRALWTTVQRHPPLQWVGRCGLTHLAHAAVDVALWDLKAQAAGEPLWRLLGGSGNGGSRPTTPTAAGSTAATSSCAPRPRRGWRRATAPSRSRSVAATRADASIPGATSAASS